MLVIKAIMTIHTLLIVSLVTFCNTSIHSLLRYVGYSVLFSLLRNEVAVERLLKNIKYGVVV